MKLSAILLQNYSLSGFEELIVVIKDCAYNGERFLEFDIRPPFPDTPENWQDILESVFTAVENNQRLD